MAPQTYVIGIAGPSGAGKSYLAGHLARRLRAPVLALDHYYRDLSHLAPEIRAISNFDEPAALEHELLVEHVNLLRDGQRIEVPTYDFSIHTRSNQTWSLDPAPFILLEGLFALYWPELRELVSTAIYVEMEDSVCLQRRLERDVQERGRTPESVVSQYRSTVAPMAERFVRPSSHHADVIVSGSVPIDSNVSLVLNHIRWQARRKQMQSALDQLAATEPAPAR
jgi:uridine kinase